MTKETLEKAKLLDENIYYINNLLYAIKDNTVVFSSTVTGKDYRLCDLDSYTHDLIIEDMKQILNKRRDEIRNICILLYDKSCTHFVKGIETR